MKRSKHKPRFNVGGRVAVRASGRIFRIAGENRIAHEAVWYREHQYDGNIYWREDELRQLTAAERRFPRGKRP
jgi:hypothetical protein